MLAKGPLGTQMFINFYLHISPVTTPFILHSLGFKSEVEKHNSWFQM